MSSSNSSNNSNSSNRVILFLNHNETKTSFDRVAIYRRDDGMFTVYFKPDCTVDTVNDKKPIVLVQETHHDLLDYIEDMLDLFMLDIDTTPYPSIDVMIAGMPVVAVNPKNPAIRPVLVRAIRSWTKSHPAVAAASTVTPNV